MNFRASNALLIALFRYCSVEENMSEEDFCRHMLYTSSLTTKRKEKMLARVSKRFKGKGPGISFTAFKNFYNVLFGGADLERAMFYLDTEGRGVNREEFAKIAAWVCNQVRLPQKFFELRYDNNDNGSF